jgi:hypothetical protein
MNDRKPSKPAPRNWQELLTTVTTALFLVIAVTGVMLLFGVAEGAVKGAHEWLGLLFALVAAAHAVYHWRPILAYARRPALWIATAAALLATFAFVVPSQAVHGPNPMRAVMEMISAAPLDRVAGLIDVDARELETKLRAAGVQFDGSNPSLKEIERASGRHMPELLAIITRK